MTEQTQTTKWTGKCAICSNWFEHPKKGAENPSPHGTFCPVCRERKMIAPGVVHFKPEVSAT